MRYLPLVLTVGLVALPAGSLPAWSQPAGFTLYDLADAAKTSRPDAALAQARVNTAHTETLRAGFVLDPARGWSLLSPSEYHVLRLAFGENRPAGDEALQWFMRGAIAGSGRGDMTGLYNPVADVWLVLRWRTISGTPRIADAVFIPGLLIRRDGDPRLWTQKDVALADALAGQAAAAKNGFVGLDGERFFATVSPLRADAAQAAFVPVFDWMGSTRAWDDKTHGKQWKALHGRLVESRGEGVVSALPARVRASLAPAGLIRNDDGLVLLLVSPLAPQIVVAADYTGRGKPGLSLINLANGRAAETAGGAK